MRVTLIHNPDAGEGRPTQDELVGLLRRNGYDAKYVSAEEPNWTHALQDPGELIVAAGEDGTVAQVAKAVAGRGMPIALLPLGTANNIATSLGAWTDPNVQVARWKAARPRAFDFGIRVGRDGRESPFLESVGCGVFAEVTARGRAGARPRRPRHRVALGSNERRARDVPRRAARGATAAGVSLDGVDHSGEYLLVEAMNIACIGPGLRLAPDADPGDGRLDVVTAGEAHHAAIEELLGRRVAAPALVVRRAREVRIETSQQFSHCDDELCNGNPDRGVTHARIRGAAVTFLAG